MNLDKLQCEVEQKMRLLDQLPTAKPTPDIIRRAKQAARAEADRIHHLRRWRRRAQAVGAAAAAVALALGLATLSPEAPMAPPSEAETALDDWSAALDDSAGRFAGLFEEDWLERDLEDGQRPEQELRDLLDSLDETFESFEEL